MLSRAMYGAGLVEHSGLVLGVSLGFDDCAEHEGGIKGIRDSFGIHLGDLVGYEARRITKLPCHVYSGQNEATKGTYLVYDHGLGIGKPDFKDRKFVWREPNPEEVKKRIQRLLEGNLAIRGRSLLATAWDSDGFGIHGNSAQYGQVISDLSDAFLQEDVVIDDSSDLRRPGFSLLIYSRIPEELKDKFRREDEIKRKAKSD